MKIKDIVTIFWICSLILIIFNATQTGSQSSGFSLNVAIFVQTLLRNININTSIDTIHVIIRLYGHITQYMIFGYLSCWMIFIYQVSWYNIFGIIFVMFIDEGLQFVTPGRHAEFKDILMDTLGVLISYILYQISKRLLMKHGG